MEPFERPSVQELKTSGNVPGLIEALGSEAEYVRYDAAEALGEIGDASAVEPLIAALADSGERVRIGAAWALKKLGDPRLVGPVIALLGDEDAYVRAEATRILWSVRDPRAIEPLIRALRDDDADVRIGAAEALGQMGHGPTIAKELGAVEEELKSLHERTQQDAGNILIASVYQKLGMSAPNAPAGTPTLERIQELERERDRLRTELTEV